jgi:hypothetical protein
MNKLLIAALAASTIVTACGQPAAVADTELDGNASGAAVATTTTTAGPARSRSAVAPAVARRPAAPRSVTIPQGTELQLSLNTAVASDTSQVEDAVSANLSSAVIVGGRTVLPAGARVAGIVSGADDSGRVKGRARMELDFTSVTTDGLQYDMSTAPVARMAAATKGEDATKIGIGAGAGAVIGGLLGGKKGAAQGAVVGGGAGTGVVLATKGKEVRLAVGTDVSTRLTAPLTVQIAN